MIIKYKSEAMINRKKLRKAVEAQSRKSGFVMWL